MHEQVEIGDKNEYIHPICSGIDVHKKKLFAAIHIYDKKNNQVRYITACFTTFPKADQGKGHIDDGVIFSGENSRSVAGCHQQDTAHDGLFTADLR